VSHSPGTVPEYNSSSAATATALSLSPSSRGRMRLPSLTCPSVKPSAYLRQLSRSVGMSALRCTLTAKLSPQGTRCIPSRRCPPRSGLIPGSLEIRSRASAAQRQPHLTYLSWCVGACLRLHLLPKGVADGVRPVREDDLHRHATCATQYQTHCCAAAHRLLTLTL
jgi:hypothetical protein